MKLHSLLLPAVLSGSAFATSCINTAFALVPTCAQSCILSGAPSVGCGSTDFACQCEKTAALFAAVDSCVALSCPADSYQAVIDGVDLVCECISPVVLRRQGGTASVSGTVVGTVTNTATATATGTVVSTTGTSPTATATATASGSGTATTGESQSYSATWTGYTSVSNVATASVVGAAARPTVGANVVRYVIPVAMAGAALL